MMIYDGVVLVKVFDGEFYGDDKVNFLWVWDDLGDGFVY